LRLRTAHIPLPCQVQLLQDVPLLPLFISAADSGDVELSPPPLSPNFLQVSPRHHPVFFSPLPLSKMPPSFLVTQPLGNRLICLKIRFSTFLRPPHAGGLEQLTPPPLSADSVHTQLCCLHTTFLGPMIASVWCPPVQTQKNFFFKMPSSSPLSIFCHSEDGRVLRHSFFFSYQAGKGIARLLPLLHF